jgi:hypothetical protein
MDCLHSPYYEGVSHQVYLAPTVEVPLAGALGEGQGRALPLRLLDHEFMKETITIRDRAANVETGVVNMGRS